MTNYKCKRCDYVTTDLDELMKHLDGHEDVMFKNFYTTVKRVFETGDMDRLYEAVADLLGDNDTPPSTVGRSCENCGHEAKTSCESVGLNPCSQWKPIKKDSDTPPSTVEKEAREMYSFWDEETKKYYAEKMLPQWILHLRSDEEITNRNGVAGILEDLCNELRENLGLKRKRFWPEELPPSEKVDAESEVSVEEKEGN